MALQTISSAQARTRWRALLDLASQQGVDIVIERNGKAIAVVISYETYQAIQPALAELRASLSAKKRGQQMAAVLEELAQMPDPAPIKDPVAWQREQRRDRILPGREKELPR